MEDISSRLKQAVEYLVDRDYVKSRAALSREIGVSPSFLCMAMLGRRKVPATMMLTLCEKYPVNFWWLRNGEGDMVGRSNRELALLAKIEELEGRIKELEGR